MWAAKGVQAASPPQLQIRGPDPLSHRVRLSSAFQTNTLLRLETSGNLSTWQEIGTLHDGMFEYPDWQVASLPARYYRLSATGRGPGDDWKNQILFPSEPFRSSNSDLEIGWVKFAILLKDPVRVFYQDSRKFLLHYDFATQRLADCRGMDYETFNAISLDRQNQQLVLGAVLCPPGGALVPWGGGIAEYGIQSDGLDAYKPDEIGNWFDLVKATVHAAPGTTPYYMPSFEQLEAALGNAEAFAARGIPVSSAERWISENASYATGWAAAAQILPGARDPIRVQ